MNRALLRKLPVVLVALAALAAVGATAATEESDAVKNAEGLWAYTALIAGGKKENMPLTGVILFKDGMFAQQSIFDGAPFETTPGAHVHVDGHLQDGQQQRHDQQRDHDEVDDGAAALAVVTKTGVPVSHQRR